jgi:uncharacterized membrane protein YqgA involved in biofilm formation
VRITFIGIGLFTLFVGIQMASDTGNYLILIFSIVLGGITGELLDLEGRLEACGERLKARFSSREDRFMEGFMTATLLFCVGTLATLGAVEDGLGQFPKLLLTKSMLDGTSSIALSASMGAGVPFAIIPMVLYQGGVSLFASHAAQVLSPAVVSEISAAGGLMLIGLGISVLDIRKLPVTNFLPALVFAGVLGHFFM